MPIREYVTDGGELVEVLQGSGDSSVPKGWKKLISSASFSTGSVREESLPDKMKKAYYKKECDLGSRFKSSYSKSTVKKAWGW